MGGEDHLDGLLANLTGAHLPEQLDELIEEIGVQGALGLLDGDEVRRGVLVLEHDESEQQHRAVGDLCWGEPQVRVPAILEAEAMSSLVGGLKIHIAEHRDEPTQFLGDSRLLLARQGREDIGEVIASRVQCLGACENILSAQRVEIERQRLSGMDS